MSLMDAGTDRPICVNEMVVYVFKIRRRRIDFNMFKC